MRIPDDVLKSVCFLCVKERVRPEQHHLFGTAFLVSVLSDVSPADSCYVYLVTARHNITKARALIRREPGNYYPELFVRINSMNGKAQTVALPEEWCFPTDDAIDAAVMYAEHLIEGPFDCRHLPMACSATENKIRDHGIGIGSEVFVSGLFSLHKGEARNLPIVRQGIIASMIHEPIFNDETGEKYRVYLTEVLAIKGMSGSPVLVKSNREYVAGEYPPCPLLLLGLMKGHFPAELEGYPEENGEDFHAGLSTVVPVDEILKLINEGALMKQRKEEEQKQITERS